MLLIERKVGEIILLLLHGISSYLLSPLINSFAYKQHYIITPFNHHYLLYLGLLVLVLCDVASLIILLCGVPPSRLDGSIRKVWHLYYSPCHIVIFLGLFILDFTVSYLYLEIHLCVSNISRCPFPSH